MKDRAKKIMLQNGVKYTKKSLPSSNENKDNAVLKRKYGITLDDFREMFVNQGGVCAICGGINRHLKRLAVDHDHENGEVRGLLCTFCNLGLGYFKDDVQNLEMAIKYLVAFQHKRNCKKLGLQYKG